MLCYYHQTIKTYFTMKKTLFTIAAQLFFCSILLGQNKTEIVHFHSKNELKKADLYAKYPHFDEIAFPSMPNKAEKHQLLEDEWHRLWSGFIDFYHAKGLFPDKKYKIDVCLHFDEKGHIDYLGYYFNKESAFTEKFIAYFTEYMQTFTFKAQSGVKFSKCGRLEIFEKKN